MIQEGVQLRLTAEWQAIVDGPRAAVVLCAWSWAAAEVYIGAAPPDNPETRGRPLAHNAPHEGALAEGETVYARGYGAIITWSSNPLKSTGGVVSTAPTGGDASTAVPGTDDEATGIAPASMPSMSMADLRALDAPDSMPAPVVDVEGSYWHWPAGADAPRRLVSGGRLFDPAKMLYDGTSPLVVDFRDAPFLTALGIESTDPVSVNFAEIAGRVVGTLDPDLGLVLRHGQTGWRGVMGFRALGYDVSKGPDVEWIVSARADAVYAMFGVSPWGSDADDAPIAQGYYAGHMAYLRRASATETEISRLYSGDGGRGASAIGYRASAVLSQGGVANKAPYQSWFRITFTGGGGVAAQVRAQRIDPTGASSAGLFGDGVNTADPPSVWAPGVYRGIRDSHAYPALSLHRADAGVAVMALRIG